MTTITAALLAEIREKSGRVVKAYDEKLPRMVVEQDLGSEARKILALVAALEEAQRDAHATRIRNMEQALRETGAECDALRDENAKLREALEPFADIRDYLDSETEGYEDDEELSICTNDITGRIHGLFTGLRLAVFSRARAALKDTAHA